MQKSIITVEKEKLISFLSEIEVFMLTNLPELCEECCSSNEIQNLKHVLGKSKLDFYVYIVSLRQFVLHVRNCIRMRSSLIGNPEAQSVRIHVEQWFATKRDISKEATKEEFLSIASRLVDEAFCHLSEILLDMVFQEVDKNIKRTLAKRIPKKK
ncbi:MAG: hypothetical protein WCI36_02485 [bacterium]